MTLLSPNHNHAADECIAQIPQHHIPTAEEKVRASECFDKSVLVAAHMAALHDAYILEMATHPVNEVVIKPSSPTSSIGGLKPSTLKQLKVGKVHRRRVLSGTLCAKTLCTKGQKGFMVVNVLEDEEGNATPIYLSNAMEGNGGSMQAQQMYPQDSKVAVKEPYLTRLPDGEIVLLVEKTSDLVFLWVPEIVKEDGDANQDPKDNGLYEGGPDAFAVEKTEEASVNGGHINEDEGKDGGVKVVDNEKGNDKLGEDDAGEEAVKCSKASRELKFEDVVNVKEQEGSNEMANDEKPQGDAEVISSGENVNEEDDIEKNLVDVKEEEAKEGDVEAALAESMGKNSEDVKEDETKEVEVESAAAADGDNLLKYPLDVKEEEAKEGEVETAEATKGDTSRGVSLEDMLATHKGEQEGGDIAKTRGGEDGGNVTEVCSLKSGVIDVGGVEEEPSNRDLNQGKLGAPPVDVDAGETAASLRVKGNTIFARGDFNKAASVYARAAEKAHADGLMMEEILCLSNRAEVWIRLCRNQAAFDDAEAALKLLREYEGMDAGDLTLAKALFRKGRALMGLHKYEDAMRVLQEVLAKAPADRQLREAAIKCRNRLQQVLKPGKRQRAAAKRRKSGSFAMQ